MSDKTLRILMVDDHPIVLAGLKALVQADPGMEVVGEARDGRTAQKLASSLRPDVVVLDISMPEMGGAEVARALLAEQPKCRILILSVHEDRATLRQLLDLGVAGYLVKRSAADELLRAIHAVAAGGTYLDPAIAGKVVSGGGQGASRSPSGHTTELSERETDVVRLIANGHSNKEISARLAISVKTIETYKARAMEKLGFKTRVDVVRYAASRAGCRIGDRGRGQGTIRVAGFRTPPDFDRCDPISIDANRHEPSDSPRRMTVENRQIDNQLQHGKRLHGAGRLAEAGQVYKQVLAAAPGHADAQHMMGVLQLQIGQPAQGLAWIERAIGSGGAVASALMAEFHVHRAHALLALGRAAEAAAACRAALQLKRGYAEADQALGHALIDTGDHAGALKAYQEAARLKPDLPDLLNNLGTALHHENRLDEAARTLTRAHGREPRDPGILVNLSTVLRDQGRFAELEFRLAAALRLAPGDPAALYDHALLMLLLGRFEKAWPGWEERFRAGATLDRGFTKPRWRGEPLAGRTLLIHAEQGLGDTIQFCRYPFPDGGTVVFEVQPRIARLLASRRGAPRMVRAGEPLPAFDLTCPLMSLPAIRQTTEATIPADIPYLFAEPELAARWREKLGDHGFRVGIVWQGNPSRREDNGRSIRLEQYLPLASVPGVRLISLQKDTGAEQLIPGMAVQTLGDDFDSGPDGFIDTAAVMMGLDLVISSDTAVAHLAGALGRPVWVALRAVPDWRFMLERTDSLWYPTMRLFRQTARDQWGPVFSAMKDALAAEVAKRNG